MNINKEKLTAIMDCSLLATGRYQFIEGLRREVLDDIQVLKSQIAIFESKGQGKSEACKTTHQHLDNARFEAERMQRLIDEMAIDDIAIFEKKEQVEQFLRKNPQRDLYIPVGE